MNRHLVIKARPVCPWKPECGFVCMYWTKPGKQGRKLTDGQGNVRVFETEEAAMGAHLEVVEAMA